MEFKIKNRFTDYVLYSTEAESLCRAIEKAVESGADLREANLRGAYLQGAHLQYADLQGAYLRGANLRGAYLQGAYLQGADLRGAYLRGANLSMANLREANLQGADLQGAYLQGANLQYAYLQGADLRGAYLRGADLQGALGVNKNLCTPLQSLLDQPGKIRAYKLVTTSGTGPHYPSIVYEIGKSYEVSDACIDDTEQCAAGINVATLDWCMKEWMSGYRILIVEFEAQDIACIPIATDGKFRLHRCTVVGEKDLKEIGLTQ